MFGFFERLINPFPPEAPTQPPTSLWAFVRHYTQGIERYLLAMAFCTALIAGLEVGLFALLGELVDWLSEKNRATFMREEGATLLWLGLGIMILIPVIVTIQALIVHQSLLGNYPMIVRWKAHRYLLGQSLSFYQNDFAGRIATKVMQTALSVRESVMQLLEVMLYVAIYFISIVAVIANADLRLTPPLAFWLVGYIFLLRYFLPRLQRISERQADARSSMTGRIVDSYTNIITLKLFSHSERESDYAKEGMQEFLGTVHPQMRLVTGFEVSVWLLNLALIVSIVTLSIYLWLGESITTGAIAVSVALALRLNSMSHWVMWEISSLFENIGTTQDGMATLAKPQEVVDEADAKPLRVEQGKIEFKDLYFDYGGSADIFEGLNFTIRPGEKVGLVGRSGAGKSTLVNLLLRFYDLNAGQIDIDGQSIRHVTQTSLRETIGMVTQDTSLLHRSVRENILFGKPDATEAQMIEAAERAEAHDFIQNLADAEGRRGYDARVGERGVKLSGGQRQRVAIARVLLKDAPILILDEATSALDSEVEASIQRSLNRLMQGKTVIAIAHRLSTIAALDRLIVLEQGRIVEEGTHAQLLRAGGLYAQLWTHQSGGFLGQE